MFQPVRQVSVNFADNEKQSNKTFNILYFMYGAQNEAYKTIY